MAGRARRLLAQAGPSDVRLHELALVAAGGSPAQATTGDRPGVAATGGAAGLQLRELRGLQLACAGVLALLVTRLAGGPFTPAGVVLALPAAWGGSMLPVWWLSAHGARRMRDLRAVLPDGLELVRACVAGGLPLRRALAAAAGHCREPLAGELAALAAATGMGVPLLDAIDEFAARNPLPEVRALAVAIRQAERHGMPLAQVLGAIADDARRARERAIADRAAAAAPQIQLVVAALLVPAALLELAALLLAAVARGELRLL